MLLLAPFILHPGADAATLAAGVARSAALFCMFTAVAWKLLPALVLQASMGGKVFTGSKWSTEAHTLADTVFRNAGHSCTKSLVGTHATGDSTPGSVAGKGSMHKELCQDVDAGIHV